MTPNQLFQQATGVSTSSLTLVVASIMMMLLLTWVGGLAFGQFALFSERQVSFFDLLVLILRAVVMLSLLGYLIR